MKNIVFILSFLCFNFLGFSQSEEITKEINKIIRYDTEISFEDTPGFIVGIIDQDTNFVMGFGSFAEVSEDLLNEMVFEVGAITKLMTASLCQILEKDSLISLTTPVNKYLPEEFRNPRMSNLTLEQLINHFSGFPKRPKDFGRKEKEINNPYKYYQKEDLLKFYSEYIPKEKEKQDFLYSHLNYAMAEIVIEFATHKPFESLLMQYLFIPLEMKNSFIHFDEHTVPLLTQGYNRAGVKVEPWNFQSFGASEGVKTNMNDLIKFLRAQLDAAYFEFTHDVVGPTDISKYISMAQGWYKIDNKDADLYAHSGKTSGHYAYVNMVKETKTGVVILANSSVGTQDLAYLILRMVNFNWNRKHEQ